MAKLNPDQSKKFLINSLIVFATLFIICFALESVSFYLTDKHEEITCTDCEYFKADKRYGYVAIPNSVVESSQTCGTELCYKAKYTFDPYSRRATGLDVKSDQHLLVFGCSVTFGIGLNDEDTLPHLLQKKSSARVYNYAKGASGPAHTLALLESVEIQNQVPEKAGLGLYFLMPFHSERVSLSTRTPWLWRTPAYEQTAEGDVRYVGSQSEANPFVYKLYSFYNSVRRHSYFLQLLDRNFDINSQAENEALVAAILKKAKQVYESKFSGRFLVITPKSIPVTLMKNLQDADVEVVQIDNRGSPKNDRICRCDAHPNGERNRFITDAVTKAISAKK